MSSRFGVGIALALALALGSAKPAAAASPQEVAALLAAPCPSEYRNVYQRDWSPTEQQAALAGDFPVMQDWRSNTLVVPVDWSQDPFRSLSWRHWLHTLGTWMDALFYIHREGGPNAAQALTQARDLTLDWIAQNPQGPPDRLNPPWAPKPTADRAPYIAYLARQAACEGLLSNAQAETLLDSLRYHASYMVAHHPPTSKGMWADYGLALTGQYLYFLAESEGWQELAIERFKPVIAERFDELDKFWLTNSANYQAALGDLVERFYADVDPDPELAEIATAMRDGLGWFVLPDRSLTLFGDYHTNSPLQPWVAQTGAGHRGLHTMRRAGYAMVKTRRSYFAAGASYFFDSHKHADDLGFELYERGRRLISDSGHHDFDSSRWEAFAESTRAHSVLRVDGAEFPIKRKAYGSGILASGRGSGWFAVLGRNPSVRRQGVRHHRLYLYRPGERLLVVDVVRSRRSHLYRRYVQIGVGIEARNAGAALALTAPGLKATVRSSGQAAKRRVVEGETQPIAGWVFPDTDQKLPRPTVIYRSRARSAQWLTELRLGRARTPTARVLSASPRRARISLSGKRGSGRTVSVARAGAKLKITVR